MPQIDLAELQKSIGRELREPDIITPRLARAFTSTMSPYLAPVPAGDSPLGLHWCLAPAPAAPMEELALDGHPPGGGIFPAVPLPRRMWAGGEVQLLAPLPVGGAVERRSVITDVKLKQGRTGVLCFFSVQHEFWAGGVAAIRETQSVVYRDAAKPGENAQGPVNQQEAAARPKPDMVWTVETPPTLLFRYSALMFNAHRIHYDMPYVTGVEGFPGLVVQGPLQAGCLFNLAAVLGGSRPKRFSCRGQAPLIGGRPFTVNAVRAADGGVECWTNDADGRINMTGAASW
jgi:3-methylfumaryl-CoA hydratase